MLTREVYIKKEETEKKRVGKDGGGWGEGERRQITQRISIGLYVIET